MIRYFSLASWAFLVTIGSNAWVAGQAVSRPVGSQQSQPARRQQGRNVPSQVQGRQVSRGGQAPAAQPNQRQPAGQPVRRQAGGAMAPDGIPLPPEHEKRVNEILRFWEFSTAKVDRYRCQFQRWEYGLRTQKSYSKGVIKFAAPDKGLFRVTKLQYPRAGKPGEKPSWVIQNEGMHEHWVCDGKSIFEFDHHRKQLVQRTLPPDMQGRRIAEGPLPFMFGAKAEQIRRRFWIVPIWPESSKKAYWLELTPKTREDAANYRKLQVVIAESDFLPKGMILFYRDGTRTNYVFESRETNWSIVAQQLNFFHREFFEPRAPAGWKKVVEPIRPATATAPAPRNGTRQARRSPTPARR